MLISFLPNLLTIIRLLLAFPIVWALLNNDSVSALWLLVIAAITDWLDGWLARHKGWESALGAFLDPLADKVLVNSLFLTLSYLSYIPCWITVITLGRDVLIVLGILIYRVWIGALHYRPIVSSKLNTVLQLSLIVALLIQRQWCFPDSVIQLISLSMVGTSIISLIGYARLWFVKVQAHVKSVS